ncbi:MAG TPA: hypothetical protein VM433_00095 [Mycobacteriales bacterium]|nr:hypothetical protein [Mycobacteriales bacterium]
MGLRRAGLWAVPVLAGGLLALPAGATSAVAGPSLADLSALPGVVAAGRDGATSSSRTVADALTSVRRHGDTAARLRGLADAVEAAYGPAGGPTPLIVTPPEEPEEGEPGEPYVYAQAVPAGDLDGDGGADVLTGSYSDDGVVLEARRGTDGSLLWTTAEQDGDGALAYPLGRDLTGDGRDDLLLHSIVGEGEAAFEEGVDGYSYRYTATFVHTVGVISGADASTAWSRQAEGSIDETESARFDPIGLTWSYEYELRSTALGVLALLTDDVTGDGLADIATSVIDLDVSDAGSGLSAFVAGVHERTATLRSGTSADVHEGATGAVRGSRTVADQAGISVLVPMGQVGGSPAADLLWTTSLERDHDQTCVYAVVVGECQDDSTGREAVDLELLDGAQLSPLWSTTTDGSWPFVTPLGSDADSDGAPDLVLGIDAPSPRLQLVSGADGSVLWEVADDRYLFALGTATGPDGAVVLLAGIDVEFGFGLIGPGEVAVETTVERRAARTGDLRSSEAHRAAVLTTPDTDSLGFAIALDPSADVDGDGVPELVVGVGAEASGGASGQARSVNVVEQLATGEDLRAETSDDLRIVVPYGDLDGDVAVDLARLVISFSDDDEDFGIDVDATAFRFGDDRQLWRFTGDLWDLPLPAGDQDRRPGEELLSMAQEAEMPVVVSHRGADLGERWRAAARTAPVRDLPSSG